MFKILITLFVLLTSVFAVNYTEDGIRFEDVKYPFEVSYFNTTINDKKYQMAYMDLKPQKPNGKSVVLLHGKNFTGAYWEETAKVLAKNGYRVIIPDQIGFGKSSKPEFYPYSFAQFVQNTKMLLESLDIEKTDMIGHSMGGMIAMRFAIMYPQYVQKLVLEDPIGLEDWQKFVPFISMDAWYKKELSVTMDSMRSYQLKSYYDDKWKPEYDKWLELQTNPLKSKNFPRAAYNQALIDNMIFTQPVIYEINQIKVPTLLIIGLRDKTAIGKDLADAAVREQMGNYKELGRNANKLIPNSKLIELDNIGHMPHIESFEAFIKPIVEFLNN